MKPISILALEKTPGVGSKTIEKILSITPTLKLRGPSDIIEILKKTKANSKRILIPDIEDATIGWKNANEIWKLSKSRCITDRTNYIFPAP